MNNVTIVIPLFNDEKYIKKTIISAISQAEAVIVSDNCSTDNSFIICKKLQKKFKNLQVFKQKKNIGVVENHRFLLTKVTTKYMMNMGSHDILEKNYIEANLNNLKEFPNAIMSYSKVKHINEEGQILVTKKLNNLDKYLSSNSISKRIYKTITMKYNYIYFGLFKTKYFIKAFKNIKVEPGIDHLVMSKTVTYGKFIKTNKTTFYLREFIRENGDEKYLERIKGERNDRVFDMSYTCENQLKILKKHLKEDHNLVNYYLYSKAKNNLIKRYSYHCINYKLSKIKEIINKNKKIILYGAGANARFLINNIQANKIAYILDKDLKKRNTNINEIKIFNLDYIKKDKNYPIIITLYSSLGKKIKNELIKNYKVPEKRIFTLELE